MSNITTEMCRAFQPDCAGNNHKAVPEITMCGVQQREKIFFSQKFCGRIFAGKSNYAADNNPQNRIFEMCRAFQHPARHRSFWEIVC